LTIIPDTATVSRKKRLIVVNALCKTAWKTSKECFEIGFTLGKINLKPKHF